MNDIYAHIISFDWQSAVLAYNIGQPGFVEAEVLHTNEIIKSEEAAGIGRIYIENLPAETQIFIRFRYPNGVQDLSFTTLPFPAGEKQGEFALIADPHISTKQENRKGRFFIESRAIAEDIISQCEALGIKTTLWAGDITNAGTMEEYESAAMVLNGLPESPFLIPGNHDINQELWCRYFGVNRQVRYINGLGTVIGIDTSDKILHPEDIECIKHYLHKDGKVIIMTHYQLFSSPDINHAGAEAFVPGNIDEYSHLMQELSNTPSVIYAGHQNIMSVTRIGKAVQINLPQPPQYPCGWLRVRCFANGIYYTFMPISSEVLRQWSRTASDDAAVFYKQRQWLSAYRRGRFPESGNFYLESKSI